MRKFWQARRFVFILFVAGASGCSTDQINFSRVINEPAPLPPEVRASFGTVGMLSVSARPEIDSHNSPQSRPGPIIIPGMANPLFPAKIELAANAVSDSPNLVQKSEPDHAKPEPDASQAGPSPLPDVSQPNSVTHYTPASRFVQAGHEPMINGAPSQRRENHTSTSQLPQTGRQSVTNVAQPNKGVDHGPASKPAGREASHHPHENKKESDNDDGLAGAGVGMAAALAVAGLVGAGEVVKLVVDKVQEMEAAKSAERLRRSGGLLRQIATKDPLEPGIEKRLKELALRRDWGKLVTIPKPALDAVESRSDYPALTSAGVDSVLELQISDERFISRGIRSVNLLVQARVAVVRAADGDVLHTGEIDYQSCPRSYADWKANHAKHLQAERKQARELLAEVLMEQLFGVQPAAQ